MEGDVIVTQELFSYKFEGENADGSLKGRFESSGLRPFFATGGILRPRPPARGGDGLMDPLAIGILGWPFCRGARAGHRPGRPGTQADDAARPPLVAHEPGGARNAAVPALSGSVAAASTTWSPDDAAAGSLRARLAATGLNVSLGRYGLICAGLAAVIPMLLMLKGMAPVGAILIGVLAGLGLPHMAVGWLAKRRRGKFAKLFPEAIGLMVAA